MMAVPALFHANGDVRAASIELILILYTLVGEEVREIVLNIPEIKD